MRPLKIAFLTGSESASTIEAIDRICSLPDIQPAGIIFDAGHVKLSRRFKNLKNNIRRDGARYPLFRLVGIARRITDALVARTAISRTRVDDILRRAFPDRCFSLDDVARKHAVKVATVPDLNTVAAEAQLRSLDADLGIVLGTRVLRPHIFNVPRMGCINLHKGRVPDYRGLPPGFWELYDNAASAGVTVHFVNSGLDTGDVIATAEVPIDPRDTPDTLSSKLDQAGNKLLMDAVQDVRNGAAARKPQAAGSTPARTKPSRAAVARLRQRLPHWQVRSDRAVILKNLYCLAVYWSGIYALVRAWHRRHGNRAAILLFHRVNDYAGDILTTDTDSFAAQLLALSQRYPLTDTDSLVDAVEKKRPFPATSVAIHFDDCYRDIFNNAAPVLKTLNLPATFFINPGFLDTDRIFPHDSGKSPFRFENLRSPELQSLRRDGFGIGAHTVNHVDLGACPVADAEVEIVESGLQLTRILEAPVKLFSFPFGAPENIRKETADIVVRAQYQALFSAYGGFVDHSSSVWDIPRFGVSGDTRPLYLLLEVEGLALAQVRTALQKLNPGAGKPGAASMNPKLRSAPTANL